MTEPNHIAEARKKVSRPQIREAFLRNGARIEPGRDDLPDWVYESVFELLEMDAPAVQGEPVAWQRVDRPERIITVLSRRTWKEVEDGVEFRALYSTSQPTEQQPAPDVDVLVEALEKIAAFQPKDILCGSGWKEWNRAGEYAASIARDALTAHRKGGEV